MKLRRPSVRVEDDRGNPVNLFQVKEMAALETGKKAAVNALGKRGTAFASRFLKRPQTCTAAPVWALGPRCAGAKVPIDHNRSQKFNVRLEHVYRLD